MVILRVLILWDKNKIVVWYGRVESNVFAYYETLPYSSARLRAFVADLPSDCRVSYTIDPLAALWINPVIYDV